MIYAYDQYAQMPVRDLYDSAIMQMAIGAAKDMYDTRRKDFKEFKEKYADFYSPFQKDMRRYGEMMDYVKSKVDDAYAKGIDILRSPEGRVILDRITNSIDPAEYNMMRHNAKVGEAYQIALAKLRSEGKFSQDMEDYRLRSLGIPSFDEFSTYGKNGLNAWGEYSPVQYKGLQELTEDWYDKRTPYQLSADKAKEVLGKSYDPRYKYTGFLDEDLMKIAGDKTPGWQGSFYSDYYRDLARKQLAAEGKDYTDKNKVEERLQRNIANSQQKWLVNPTGSISDYAQLTSLAQAAERNRIARENLNYKKQKDAEENNERLVGWTGRRIYNTEIAKRYNNYDAIQERYNKAVDRRAKGQKGESIHNLAWRLYRAGQDNINQEDLATAIALAAKMQTPEVINHDGSLKRPTVRFSTDDNTLSLTNTRAMQNAAQGYTGKAKLTIPTGLQDWLKQNEVKGYILSNNVTANYDAIGPYDIYDLNFSVAVNKDVLLKYYGTTDNLINRGSHEGLKIITTDGKVLSKYKSDGSALESDGADNGVRNLNWNEIQEVVIPTTRTIPATVWDRQKINHTHDVEFYTKARAEARENEYAEEE